MNTVFLFQSALSFGLVLAAAVVLFHVYHETISDKYGSIGFVSLAALFALSWNWSGFAFFSPLEITEVLFSGFSFIIFGIYFSIRMTEYSKVRRSSIQELALLRHRFEELSEKSAASETAEESVSPRSV